MAFIKINVKTVKHTGKPSKKHKSETKPETAASAPETDSEAVCPHCGCFIGYGDRDVCPQCGKKIEDRML